MKNMYTQKRWTFTFCFLFSFFSFHGFAQVGIGTVNPNGILDVESTTQGVVIPRLALTDTYIMAPAVNPNGVNIPTGTVVFNTANTANGKVAGVSDDVSRGMYFWNGTKWIPQFTRKQYKLFAQTTPNLSTRYNVAKTVPGINSQTFTANYTGTYKIELSVNYGGGQCKTPVTNGQGASDGSFNIGRQGGNFSFSYDGGNTNYTFRGETFSTANKGANGNGGNGSGNYFGIWKQWTKVYYVKLTRNDVLNFLLSFTQAASPEFDGNGDNNLPDGSFTGGNGHLGFDVPCFVEVSFIDEQ